MSRNKRVAVQIIDAHYGNEISHGICQYVSQHTPWEMRFSSCRDDFAVERLRVLVETWKPHGLITQFYRPKFDEIVKQHKMAAINVGGIESSEYQYVLPDNRNIGKIAAMYLLERRLPNWGFCGLAKMNFSMDRLAGFQGELQAHGFSPSILEIDYFKKTLLSESDIMRQWIPKLRKPIGILCCNDVLASLLVNTCVESGLRVPADVAVVGVDNDPLECSICRVPLTSVILPIRQIGFVAAQKLDEMMSRKTIPGAPILIPPHGIAQRKSSDAWFVEDAILTEAIKFIREHAAESINVSDVLSHVRISRRSLEYRFMNSLGRTPHEQIALSKMELAKDLLEKSNLKMVQLASRVGFSSYKAFRTTFIRLTGTAPLAYRTIAQQGR